MKLVVHLADFGWPVEADELAWPVSSATWAG